MQVHITCTISVQVTAAYLSHTTPNTTKDDPYPIPTTALNPHSHPTHPHAENAREKKKKTKKRGEKDRQGDKERGGESGVEGGGGERDRLPSCSTQRVLSPP